MNREEIRAEALTQLDALTIALAKAKAKGDDKACADIEIIAAQADKIRSKIEESRPQPYSLRLEPETRAKLEAIAKANGRSLNTQIVMMLESQMQSEEAPTMNDDLDERMRQIALKIFQEEFAPLFKARKKKPE